jgi:hypothetical protein
VRQLRLWRSVCGVRSAAIARRVHELECPSLSRLRHSGAISIAFPYTKLDNTVHKHPRQSRTERITPHNTHVTERRLESETTLG